MTKENLKKAADGYVPRPADLDAVDLPAPLTALTEIIARNTHEVWAMKRISEGWTYGATRDDAGKRHPNLIPYEFLTEEDKDYDRATAMNAIRLMVSLGYSIVPPEKTDIPDTEA